MGYLQRHKEKLFAEITTIPEIVRGSYFPALDGLRGVAVMMVILYHFGANRFLRPFHILINGDMGVDIFFVISGFLITTLLLKERVIYGRVSLKRFYIRRAFRIIPAAYLFLIVMIILALFFKYGVSASDFIASFLFYKNLPYWEEPYMGHFWSLAAEVQFYLIFPFLLTLNVNRYLVIIGSIVLVMPLISIMGYYHADFLFSNHFIQMITKITMYTFWKGPFIILIGSLFAVLLFKGVIKIKKQGGNYLLSFILLIIAITISSTSFTFYTKYASEYLSAILIGWVILLNLGKRNLLSAVLGSQVLVKIGVISYSLYLWQQLFIGNRFRLQWVTHLHTTLPAVLILIKLASLFMIAFASYYFVEMRFLKIKYKYEPGGKPKSL
ncbi:acyltransferase [Mucilaginibacter sp. BJC16-A38]|uniref:acyltransferase family protein n=1 Tax=Mucilaginibacter phenanthrenivorans TaxID=1234842 RepID=UPI00215894E8|nr:acyltransferase [Mucilaginibacter phenanthrenivorans]MCR8561852.1 acyltransferase [Mucilaginibacter phenanthrenivorans]